MSFFLYKLLNINILSSSLFNTSIRDREIEVSLDDIKLDLSQYEIGASCNIKGLSVIISLNKTIILTIKDIEFESLNEKIILDYLNNNNNNNLDRKWYLDMFDIFTINILKISFIFNTQCKITLNCYNCELSFNKNNEHILKINKIKLDYTNDNYLTLNNLQFIKKKNNIDLNISNIYFSIDPIIFYVIEKYVYLLSNNKKDKSIYILNINIDNITFVFIDIYLTLIHLEIKHPNCNIRCRHFNLYDKNNSYLKIQQISINNKLKNIDNIYILINDKLISIIDTFRTICNCYFTKNKPLLIKQFKQNKIIENHNSNNNIKLDDYIIINNTIPIKKIVNKIININKIVIDFYNKEKLFNISIIDIKYILYKDKSNYYRIRDVCIRDLTDKKWDYILYKEDIKNFIEISIKQVDNESNCDVYDIYIKPSNIIINLDEYCLKKSLPLFKNIHKLLDKIINFLPNTPIYIKNTIIRENIIIFSYKPRDINIKNIIKGNTKEFIKIGAIHDYNIKFKELRFNNMYSFGDLFRKIFITYEKNILKKGVDILLHNEKLKLLLSPFRHISKINETNILDYFKNISIDIVDGIDSFFNFIQYNNKKKILSNSLISLQYYADKQRKNNKKYKQF